MNKFVSTYIVLFDLGCESPSLIHILLILNRIKNFLFCYP